MFNPHYSMSFCELTPTIYTDKAMQAELKDYLEKKLYRTVVEVKDSPGLSLSTVLDSSLSTRRFNTRNGLRITAASITLMQSLVPLPHELWPHCYEVTSVKRLVWQSTNFS